MPDLISAPAVPAPGAMPIAPAVPAPTTATTPTAPIGVLDVGAYDRLFERRRRECEGRRWAGRSDDK
jgi:hypothetical protein